MILLIIVIFIKHGKEEIMDIRFVSLNDIKWWAERYLQEKKGRVVKIAIHISTALDKVKANVQGVGGEFDVVISGELKFEDILKAVAHEVAHIVLMSEEHGERFDGEMEKVKKYLEEKLLEEIKRKGGEGV